MSINEEVFYVASSQNPGHPSKEKALEEATNAIRIGHGEVRIYKSVCIAVVKPAEILARVDWFNGEAP